VLASGDWSTPGNWSDGAVPASGDLAIIQSGKAVATTVYVDNEIVWLDGTSNQAVILDLIGSRRRL
jgi:hypothetical protein